MLFKLSIAVLLMIHIASCSGSKMAYRPYAEDGADSFYHAVYVTGPGVHNAGCMGFYTYSYLQKSISFDENSILDGLVLPAKSIIHRTEEIELFFGTGTDIFSFQYKKRLNSTRKGRSALMSVMNAVSAVKGEDYTKQGEPDTTLSSVECEGRFGFNSDTTAFYSKRSFKTFSSPRYSGWLALKGDTLRMRQSKSGSGEGREYWVELTRNDAVYAAMDITHPSSMLLYISRSFGREDMIRVMAFYAVIVNDL